MKGGRRETLSLWNAPLGAPMGRPGQGGGSMGTLTWNPGKVFRWRIACAYNRILLECVKMASAKGTWVGHQQHLV